MVVSVFAMRAGGYLTQKTTTFSSRVLSTPAEIKSLQESGLPFQDNASEPAFFLGSVARNWIPRVVAVSRDDSLAGIVYLKERVLAGWASGILSGDDSFGTLIVAAEADREAVFAAALDSLLSSGSVRGLRLGLAPGSREEQTARRVAQAQGMDVTPSGVRTYHARLALPDTYEEFLEALGTRTRRNFRYYRRQFEAAGHAYYPRLSREECREAALQLYDQCSIPSRREAVEKMLDWIEQVEQPWAAGLRSKNGDWLSVAFGCLLPRGAIMILQLNRDRAHEQLSLSSVLRSYLIESLIERGCRELVFWLGVAGPLTKYAEDYPARVLYVDRPDWTWRMARWLSRRVGGRLPLEWRNDARWIAELPDAPA